MYVRNADSGKDPERLTVLSASYVCHFLALLSVLGGSLCRAHCFTDVRLSPVSGALSQ